MDWTTPLKSQQADFIKRLKSGAANLLRCQTLGCHSELMVISGERLEQIRSQCLQLTEAEQTAPVRDLMRNHLLEQLGEEALATCLEVLVTRQDTNSAVDFTLTRDSTAGIQIQTAHGSIDSVRWCAHPEQLKQNAAAVCILLQEDISEARETYSAILAGFLPASMLQISHAPASFGIADLLYSGGLRSYLESLKSQQTSRDWLRTVTCGSTYLYPAALSADGQTLACSGYDGSIKLWKLGNSELISQLQGHSWSFYPSATGSGGHSLASGSTEKKLHLSHSGTGELLGTLAGHSSGVSSIAISSDGQILSSGGYDGTIKIWHLAGSEKVRRIAAHAGMVRPLAISPDSQILASASIDKTLKIWYINTGKLLRTLPVHPDPVVAIAISSDGQILASGSQDGTIEIWHPDTGERKNIFAGHAGTVRSLAIGDDGQTLASSSTERTIKLWDLQTGELRRTLTGHTDPLINLAPNPNGQTLDLSLFRHPLPGWADPS
jgi:hypothetical protein